MIHKIYKCHYPQGDDVWPEFKISAWQAMGSKTVNYTLSDGSGWMSCVFSEVLGKGPNLNMVTMDDIIEYLYWVVKA